MSSTQKDLQECRQTVPGVETPANKRAGADANPTLRNHCSGSTAAKASYWKSKTLPRRHTQLRWALSGEAARKNTEGMPLAKCEGYVCATILSIQTGDLLLGRFPSLLAA